ncbi:hypothetical protein KMZ68_06980 [Bradyrhizobium sediminis]|uniref:Uncharacterized protein n=1 Tax=Bradyrhizobium sediminis TaxID=2840469 RepID=A0A975RVD8_9BRAD|nr:hypothetical protein [Bradyrhizobium sediminis]QWG20776.1 hypothetical protein KMZ68_06980 [Bradyrhizobium sediminis]
MPNAYIIEVLHQTAGIVAFDERGFRFFSSQRVFDSLEGRRFRSARDAERAARALLDGRRRSASKPQFTAAL